MFFIGIFFLPLSIYVANYYVTPGGTGSKSGADWANAAGFTTMTFVRGNTYYFAGDTYT